MGQPKLYFGVPIIPRVIGQTDVDPKPPPPPKGPPRGPKRAQGKPHGTAKAVFLGSIFLSNNLISYWTERCGPKTTTPPKDPLVSGLVIFWNILVGLFRISCCHPYFLNAFIPWFEITHVAISNAGGNGISSSNVPPWRQAKSRSVPQQPAGPPPANLWHRQPAGPPPAFLWPQQHAGPPPANLWPQQHAGPPPAKKMPAVAGPPPAKVPQLIRVGKPRQGYEAPRPKHADLVALAASQVSPTAGLTPRPIAAAGLPLPPSGPSSSGADVHIYHAVGVGHFDLQSGAHIARRHISMPGQASRVRRSVQRQLYQDYGSFLENLLCLILAVGTQVLQT